MSSTSLGIAAILVVTAMGAAHAGGSGDGGGPGVTYRLNAFSSWQEGCFEACMCPIVLGETTGTFRLTPVTLTGTVDTYAVTDVQWTVGVPGTETSFTVTGGGTYLVFQEFAVLHTMSLTLSVGGGEPRTFDNELTVTTAQFPEIDILISEGDLYCLDTAFEIDASPIETCTGDTDGSGAVDIDDVMHVLLDWGGDGTQHGGDVDGSGTVNADDLVTTLLAWGPCG